MIFRGLGLMLLVALAFVGQANALPQTFVQEGLVTNRNGQPMQGNHRVSIQLYNALEGGNLLFEETHPVVAFINGYYAVSVGAEAALPDRVFDEAAVFLAFKIDDGEWLAPRVSIQREPAAFVANRADVVEQCHQVITPASVSVNGALVIDNAGKWVGTPRD